VTGLEITGLTVRFDGNAVVDDFSLAVPSQSVFALVGPSGCGKSTLLRAVAGLVTPDAGDIAWDGVSMQSVPTHERDIGLMFQDHALFTHRSVAENVAFGLKMKGVDASRRRSRVAQLLELVGLAGFEHRSITELSGGEAQRVALARALAPEPRLLLLDEPLASLDRARRVELTEELANLLSELGQTAIYVTHDQEEAFALADRVGVMSEGRLLRAGTPAELWRDPQSEFVARFVGHEAIIERDGRRYAVRSDAVSLAPPTETPPADARHTHQGLVERCSFQGDRYLVRVAALGQDVDAWTTEPIAPGTSVVLTIDPTKLAPLD